MPMCVVENGAHGNRAFCTFNEGLGKVLRYGANDARCSTAWPGSATCSRACSPARCERLGEPIDLRAMTAQALQMGDEGHNRNRAGTSLLLRELLPALIELDEPAADTAAVARFIAGNDHFYLNLTMPASKAMADAAAGIERSSIVVAMARNGTEFGVRLSGTGDRWFTGPSGMIDGLYLPGFGPEDANPDIGDSTITETVGLGGFAMAASPAIVRVVGGGAGGRARGDARDVRHHAGARAAATRSRRSASAARRPGSTAARWSTPAAAVRQHRHRPSRAGRRPDRRGAGGAADGGVREGGAGAGGAVIVAAPAVGPARSRRRRRAGGRVRRGRRLHRRVLGRAAGVAERRAGGAAAFGGRRGRRRPAARCGTRRCGSCAADLVADGPDDLVQAVAHPRPGSLAAVAGARLIGRGGGLTPEGDDLVAGVAAVVASSAWPGALREAWLGALVGAISARGPRRCPRRCWSSRFVAWAPSPLQALSAGRRWRARAARGARATRPAGRTRAARRVAAAALGRMDCTDNPTRCREPCGCTDGLDANRAGDRHPARVVASGFDALDGTTSSGARRTRAHRGLGGPARRRTNYAERVTA